MPTTDIPDFRVLTGVFTLVGTMIIAVVTWLDKRAKTQRDEVLQEHSKAIEALQHEIASLRERITNLETSQRDARKGLVGLLTESDVDSLHTGIRNVIELLH